MNKELFVKHTILYQLISLERKRIAGPQSSLYYKIRKKSFLFMFLTINEMSNFFSSQKKIYPYFIAY